MYNLKAPQHTWQKNLEPRLQCIECAHTAAELEY
jgi:hypothetical protein